MSRIHAKLTNSTLLKPTAIWAKSAVQKALAPFGLRPSRKIAGHKFRVDPATDIGLEILLTGSFESEALALCDRFVRPGGTVIDIGANIGVHTVHFARAAELVIALEPARSTFEYLLLNTLHLSNVLTLKAALSDASSVQPFFVAADNAYSGLRDTKRKKILREELVACFRGDDLLAPLVARRRVDLVKIDVEGFEAQVLQGLQETVRAHRPVIFCEIFGGQDSSVDPQRTVNFCASLGYRVLTQRGKELVETSTHDDRFYNYFFVPQPR